MTIEKLKASEPFFGSWYVDSKVAEGKNSAVFKVYKNENGIVRNKALKVIKVPGSDREISKVIASEKYETMGEYLESREKSIRSKTEKMLMLKNRKNIVSFEDYTVINESSCFYVIILMELLTPLGECLKADSVSEKEVVKLMTDLSFAIEDFRQQGITHEEIRPDNIYVDKEGNYKLGDFGIANSEDDEIEIDVSSYKAPELYLEGIKGETSDIYSLGLLCYKLLNNNRMPFLPDAPAPVSLTDRENAFKKRLTSEAFPNPVNADINLSRIVLKAAAFSPLERYYSPFLLRTELQRYENAIGSQTAENNLNSYAPYSAPTVPATPYAKSENDVVFSAYENQQEPSEEEYEDTFEDVEIMEEEAKDNKKMYFLVAALVVVLIFVIAVIVNANSDKEKNTTLPPITETTTASTTLPSTTEETTTETTTEETTTEETTTETTTEETTTEETTTEQTTTEETTTETTTEKPAETEPSTEPSLVGSNKNDGEDTGDGRIYREIVDYEITSKPKDIYFDGITLEIGDEMGSDIQIGGTVYIYQMQGASLIQKVPADLSCTFENEKIICNISVMDEDFYYETNGFQYYLCLEEGAIETEAAVSLPLQVKL